MAGTTTNNGFPYPQLADGPPDVAGDIQNLADDLDSKIGIAKINEVAVASNVFTFSSIPDEFRHLKIKGQAYASAFGEAWLRMNGDTGASNYSWAYSRQNPALVNATASQNSDSKIVFGAFQSNANRPAAFEIDIFNFREATYKYVAARCMMDGLLSGSDNFHHWAGGGMWKNTADVTSLSIAGDGVNLTANALCYATLYGLL